MTSELNWRQSIPQGGFTRAEYYALGHLMQGSAVSLLPKLPQKSMPVRPVIEIVGHLRISNTDFSDVTLA